MNKNYIIVIGIYFLTIFSASEIAVYYGEIQKTERVIEFTGNPNECWYEGNGEMIPCMIDSGDHKYQAFIMFSVIASPVLIVALVITSIIFSRTKAMRKKEK